MASSNIVTLCWLPGSRIFQNNWMLLKSHMTLAQWMKFLNMCRWYILCFSYWIAQEICIFSWSFWRILILMLCTLEVDPMHNLFRQYPFCNIFWLSQSAEYPQLHMDLVKNLFNWLLTYLKAINVQDEFDNWFTFVLWYLGLQHFSIQFNWSTSRTCHGIGIHGMIRILASNCTPILNFSKDDWTTAVGTSCDQLVIGAVWALCEFSWFVR